MQYVSNQTLPANPHTNVTPVRMQSFFQPRKQQATNPIVLLDRCGSITVL